MLEKRHTTHVPGRVPGICSLVGVLLQFAEVGRQKLILITHNREINPISNEGRGIAEQINILMYLFHHLERQLTYQRPVGDKENGDLAICLLYTSDAADEEDSVDLGGR